MVAGDSRGFRQIAGFEEEERGDGPGVDAGGFADAVAAAFARGCQDVGLELVAGVVLTSGPDGSFLSAPLKIIRRERARTLACASPPRAFR
jgi:hypothetical protein